TFGGEGRAVVRPPVRGHPLPFPDLFGAVEGEAALASEGLCDVLDDLPVASSLAGALDGPVDLDDTAFELGDGAFVLFLERAGQDDVGVPCGFAQEKVDRDVKLELFEHSPDVVVIRQRNEGIKADREQTFDLAAVDEAEDLVGVDAGLREVVRIDAPDGGDVSAVLGVGEVASAG